ncbi:hypothetical protein V8C86DRAFT_1568895 [Haematococcus lacustris]
MHACSWPAGHLSWSCHLLGQGSRAPAACCWRLLPRPAHCHLSPIQGYLMPPSGTRHANRCYHAAPPGHAVHAARQKQTSRATQGLMQPSSTQHASRCYCAAPRGHVAPTASQTGCGLTLCLAPPLATGWRATKEEEKEEEEESGHCPCFATPCKLSASHTGMSLQSELSLWRMQHPCSSPSSCCSHQPVALAAEQEGCFVASQARNLAAPTPCFRAGGLPQSCAASMPCCGPGGPTAFKNTAS